MENSGNQESQGWASSWWEKLCVRDRVPALGSSNLPSGGREVSFPTGYWALECHFQQSSTLGPSPALSDAQDVGKWILVARLSRCNVKTSPLPFNIVSIHPPRLCWGYILVLSVDPSWILLSHLLLAHSVESLLLSMPPPPHAPISPSTVNQPTVNRHCLLLGLLRACALCLLPFTGFALPYISPQGLAAPFPIFFFLIVRLGLPFFVGHRRKVTFSSHQIKDACILSTWGWWWFSRSVVSDSLWPHGLQAPLSMRFPSQEYWSGWPFPSPTIRMAYHHWRWSWSPGWDSAWFLLCKLAFPSASPYWTLQREVSMPSPT